MSNKWSGQKFVDLGKSYKNQKEGNCKQLREAVIYPSRGSGINNKNKLSDFYEEPKAVIFNYTRCGAEKNPNDNNKSNTFAEIKPNYEQIYRRVDCKESDLLKCDVLTEDDILNNGLSPLEYVPFVEKYYSNFGINTDMTKGNDPSFNVHGASYLYNNDPKNNYDSKNYDEFGEYKKTSNNPQTKHGNFSYWGPSSMEYTYNVKDTNTNKTDKWSIDYKSWDPNSNGKNNIYNDPRYQGLDKHKLYYVDSSNKTTDYIIGSDDKGKVRSVMIPPHIMLDIFEKPTYNHEYLQDIPGSDKKEYTNNDFPDIFPDTANKIDKNGWKFGLARISSIGPKVNGKSINESPIINSKLTTYKIYNGKITDAKDQSFGDNKNNKTFIVADNISFLEDLNTDYNKNKYNDIGVNELIEYSYAKDDNHMYQPTKPKSMNAIRKMPWSAFLLGCATNEIDNENKICKNYIGPTKNEQLNTITDADKFMIDYCLSTTDKGILPYNDKIPDNSKWKYDKNNNKCACIRVGKTDGKSYCNFSGCLNGNQFVPFDKRSSEECKPNNKVIDDCITNNKDNIKSMNECLIKENNLNATTCSADSFCPDEYECKSGQCSKRKLCGKDSECKSGTEKCGDKKYCVPYVAPPKTDDDEKEDEKTEDEEIDLAKILIGIMMLIFVILIGAIIYVLVKPKISSYNNLAL